MVVELKPQLERLLNLPPDSLAKEIRLTEDLLALFVTHQIPSDLLSFDGTTRTKNPLAPWRRTLLMPQVNPGSL